MMRSQPTARSKGRRNLAAVLIAIVFLTACSGSGSNSSASSGDGGPILAGYEREPEPTVGSISLPAANRDNNAFAFQADTGELLMVAFGFTSCPDICPTTLADIRLAFNQLGPRAGEVDLAWVSVDPERDDAESSANYVEAFVADGIALRTDDAEQLLIAADAFGVTFIIQENEAGETEVAHTPNVFVVDDTGSIILTWPFGVPADDMASDLTILLDRQQSTTP
ncbi:MAG: protein SCO1/2 [Acidimicrobiales bacterium]|jgi:protein SCO1/2